MVFGLSRNGGSIGRLRGMTWEHRRAIDPLTGTLASFRELHPDIDIELARAFAAGFEFQPVEELAREYDLIILDHPFMGDAARKAACWPSTAARRPGRRLSSVRRLQPIDMTMRFCAVPVDAACQVAVFRPDLMARLGCRTAAELGGGDRARQASAAAGAATRHCIPACTAS